MHSGGSARSGGVACVFCTGSGVTLFFFGRVVLMPNLGFFICTFAVAGAGARYFLIVSFVRWGNDFNWLLLTALRSVGIGGLKRL